jgi:hypothetical protein
MSDGDLFSQDWADVPVANPLPVVDATERILTAYQVPPALLRAPKPAAFVAPASAPLGFVDRDSNHLAFVAQASHYGHTNPCLEPVSTNGAGRRFFDLEAVVRFALELLGRPYDGEKDLPLELWGEAIYEARRQGWKGGRR